MEIEVAPPAENGNDISAESKKPDESPPAEVAKPSHKSRSRKRSRSRSSDVDKKLQVTLQQCDFEVNGNSEKPEEEGKKNDDKPEESGDDNFKRITRSQTTTEEEKKPDEEGEESPKKRPKKQSQPERDAESDVITITDDMEPELQFDSSDFDSVEGSPVIVKTGTRRFQTGAGKTCLEFDEDKPAERGNDSTIDSQDMVNLSTRAVIGSDVTYEEEPQPHDDSYFQQLREKSLSQTLSARKSIRSDYPRYSTRSYTPNVAGGGFKRKDRSATHEGEETKRFKSEGPSLFASLRGRFGRSEATEASPRLMGYKDRNNDLHFEEGLENGIADKKNWCNIM